MNKVKITIIKGMIQIKRPTSWTSDNIVKIANEIEGMERYNAYTKLNLRR